MSEPTGGDSPPTVVLVAVGHSYGGAGMTNAAAKANNIVGLVYVAAFVTEEGERLADAVGASKDAVLSSGPVPLHSPAANGELAVEFAIDPARSMKSSQPTCPPRRRR
jgi:pimeloyl-ACP methyl ester carboxylesterase